MARAGYAAPALAVTCLLLLLLGALLPSATAQAPSIPAGSPPPAGPAGIDQDCGYDTGLLVLPSSAAPGSAVQVICSGVWPNSCTPQADSVQALGNLIRIDGIIPSVEACPEVLTPWEFVVEVGDLSPTSYQVEFYLSGPFVEPGRLCATASVDLSSVLITELYYDTYLTGEPDEAFRLMNVGSAPVELTGWTVTDGPREGTITLQGLLDAGKSIWITRGAAPFALEFGFAPDFEYGADTDDAVPNLPKSGSFLLNNNGDEVILKDGAGTVVDTVVFEGGDPGSDGWSGVPVNPYSGSSAGAEGQILYRKRDQATGLPVLDTNRATDWAQDPGDGIDGRKVLYPGWDLDAFFFTERITQTAALTVAVAPDNLYQTMADLLGGARESIQIEGYSLRSEEVAGVLLDRLAAGVSVTLLLEGAPAFGGVTDQEKWIARQLHDHGATVLFMASDDATGVRSRYRSLHAKLAIVDGQKVLVGSENLSYASMPADDKSNGTAGRRGVYLVTDAPGVVARVQAVFQADADPLHHSDLLGCDTAPYLCTPPAGFEPEPTPDWLTYTVRFPTPQTWRGTFAFEVLQSPENSLRTQDGLLGLVRRAGQGDTLLIQQLYERDHWGSVSSTAQTDPNPRLEAYLDAARRGATVRLLLDSYLDRDGENAATVDYVRAVARAERLDLRARRANPAYLGLHNKMVLARVGGRGYVHAGSINGSEASSKINRELALQIQSDEAYLYLKALFEADWHSATPAVYLPLVRQRHSVPLPAGHLLLSEVYYATIPEKEWVEIYNPTGQAVDLSPFKVSDAVYFDDYEGAYQFPAGALILPDQALVVAITATGFQEEFPGHLPDFEMFETDPFVPNMLPYARWGEGDWGLSNAGDEILLLDGADLAVDVVAYGLGSYPELVSHPGGIAFDHSLERVPAWIDTNDCSLDFRDWPFPSPGDLPR